MGVYPCIIQKDIWLQFKNKEKWILLGNEPPRQTFFHLLWFFNKSFYEMILEFMGQRLVFNPPHIQDLTWKSNTIHKPSGLNVEDLIDLSNFEMKHDDCVYHEDLSPNWQKLSIWEQCLKSSKDNASSSFTIIHGGLEWNHRSCDPNVHDPRAHPNAHLDANTNEQCI